jgi:hypothetical protein
MPRFVADEGVDGTWADRPFGLIAVVVGGTGGDGDDDGEIDVRSTVFCCCPALDVLEECCVCVECRDSEDRRSYVGIRLEELPCLDLDRGLGVVAEVVGG